MRLDGEGNCGEKNCTGGEEGLQEKDYGLNEYKCMEENYG